MDSLAGRIADAKARIASAAARAGRKPQEIAILYATKHATEEQIAALARIEPHVIIGENRVQDAQEKFEDLRKLLPPEKFRLMEKHMIGTLQSNKARDAVGLFEAIQSVDSERLARKISLCAIEAGKTMPIYLEVNNGEGSKHGVSFGDLGSLISSASALPNIRLAGLMGMGVEGNPAATREFFRKLRQAADGHGLKTSMGMSDDFEIAVEEGSDMVRLGRAVFLV